MQVERVRVWLRSEIEKRLRNAAQRERVEVNCRSCGGVTDISVSHADKVLHGRVELPLCLDCRSPARTAEADAEVVAFVAALGDQADEFVGAIAALR